MIRSPLINPTKPKKGITQMSDALVKARAAVQARKAAGLKSNRTVTFSPEEVAAITAGMERSEYTSFVSYVKAAAAQVAGLDAQKPKRVFSKKTPEQLEAQAAKLVARAAALKAQG